MIQCINANCYGCRGCEEICPTKAITMEEDRETFLYPKIDSEKCVKCGLCDKVCPIKYEHFIDVDNAIAKVGMAKDREVILESSSGGAFTALYRYAISKEYTVYGVKYDEKMQVIIDAAKTEKECQKFRKSKYIQANTNGCFERIRKQLSNDEGVLFSGTPCQVAALNNYLSVRAQNTKKLLTISILCHGVPSQKLFDMYKEEEQKREKSEMLSFTFRYKRKDGQPINSRSAIVKFANGKEYIRDKEKDAFLRGYYQRLFYRPSCMTCEFARNERVADITIFDAWNIEKRYSHYNPLEGTSIVLAASDKGKAILEKISNEMELEELPIKWVLESQCLFRMPTSEHKNRDRFFEFFVNKGFGKAVFLCTKKSIRQRISKFCPDFIKRVVKKRGI